MLIPVCRLFHFCPICLPNSMRCLCLRNAYLCVTYVATYICPVRCIVLSACDSRAMVPVIYCSWYATCPAVPISTLLCPCILCVVPTCMYLLWHICAFLCSVCALHSLLRLALSTALFTPLCTLHSALHSSLRSALCTLNSALQSAPSTPPWVLRSIHPACYLFSSAAYIL
jgi:hypothetical protein